MSKLGKLVAKDQPIDKHGRIVLSLEDAASAIEDLLLDAPYAATVPEDLVWRLHGLMNEMWEIVSELELEPPRDGGEARTLGSYRGGQA